ncbi:MAG: ABC transporter ATP-binding protein [Bacillota bacterium]
MGSVLEVEGLSVVYAGQKREVSALRDVSFDLRPGDTLGIIGESGSGKTTLALSILGLLGAPHRVSGRVTINGKEILSLPEEEKKKLRWRQVAMVFQNSQEVLNPVLKLAEQLAEPIVRHFGLRGAELENRVKALFDLVGLPSFWLDAYPHQLSGGMLQRVLLAMALSCDPQYLIADEPTASLDAICRQEILSKIKSLQAEKGFGLVLISHDLSVVADMAERLMVLYCGEILEMGPTGEVLEGPRHPYTRGLVNSCVGRFPYKDLWGIPGEPARDAGQRCSFVARCTQAIGKCNDERPALRLVASDRQIRCHRGGIALLLECRGVTKTFTLGNHRIQALTDVSVSIKHGETVALVGVSGSGKSTLAQILSGILRPDKGELLFKGRPVNGPWATRQQGGIQLVLQDSSGSVSHRFTVEEVVSEPLIINKIGCPAERKNRVQEALRAVQLPVDEAFLSRRCFALSNGQRQRLAIARALVMEPALLLADEIVSMLDVSTQANLLRLLKGLQNEKGFSMLVITHDLHLARKISERIIVLHAGRIAEEGSVKRVMESSCCIHTQRILEAGLGSPDIKEKPFFVRSPIHPHPFEYRGDMA